MFVALYRWTPNTQVEWKPASWAALVATVLWQLATYVFTWYLRVGLGRYELVYGSLGAVVALLVLVYVIAWITLFGAHLCAAIMHQCNS
jgi:membrane protein